MASRHFAGGLNDAVRPTSEGISVVEISEQDDSCAQRLTPGTELQDVRINVKCLLGSLGESLCHGKETEMNLAVKAVYSQFVNSHKRLLADFQVDKRGIQVELIAGPPVHSSQVLNGAILKSYSPFSEEICKHLATDTREILVVLVNNDVTPHCQHLGFKQTAPVNHILRASAISAEPVGEDLWLRRVIHILQVHEIDVLVSKGVVHDSLVDYCVSSKTLVIQNVSSSTLQVLYRATGGTLISYLEHARSADIGKASKAETWSPAREHGSFTGQAEHSHYIVMEGSRGLVQTAMLCASCSDVLNDRELKFRNCLSRLTNALACGRTLPGDGGSEIACIDHLQQTAVLGGGASFKSLVYDGFARGLQDMLVNTRLNSGRFSSPLYCLSYVLSRRKGFLPSTGGDGAEEAGEHSRKPAGDSPNGGVLDDYLAKRAAWRRAVDVVCLLLQTDMLIVTAPGHHVVHHVT